MSSFPSPTTFNGERYGGYSCAGVLLSGSGFAVAYVLTNDETGAEECYALGVYGGEWAAQRLHGVTLEKFAG